MPVAELRVGFRPVRNSLVLAVGYRPGRMGVQEDQLAADFQPYATVPGRPPVPASPVELVIERPGVAGMTRPAARPPGRAARVTEGRAAPRAPTRVGKTMPGPATWDRPSDRPAASPVDATPRALRPNERPAGPRFGLAWTLRPNERQGAAAPTGPFLTRRTDHDGTVADARLVVERIKDRAAAGRPVLVLPARDPSREALAAPWRLVAVRDALRPAMRLHGVGADRDARRAAHVWTAPWLTGRTGERLAGVIWGSRPIQYLGGNTVLMRPHILGMLPDLRVVEVLPHRPPAARLDAHPADVGRALAGKRPVELRASAGRLLAGKRPVELQAVARGFAAPGERPRQLGGALVRLVAAGERPTVHGGVLARLLVGGRPTDHAALLGPAPRVGGAEDRAAVMVRLPAAGRDAVGRGLVVWQAPLFVPVPRAALVVVRQPTPDKAPKAARAEAGLWLERSLERTALRVPGRPASGELPGDLGAAPYLPRPDDNERPYDPPPPWEETGPIEGPYNPPAAPQTDPETGEPIPPPPQDHVEPPPDAIVDPETGEPRYPTGGTDPATGDPEILPPEDPLALPGDRCGSLGSVDVPEGVLLEFVARFWDVWQAYQVYYGHVTASEALRHLMGDLMRWLEDNGHDDRYWVLYCALKDCARAAVMRYCPTYLRREWREEEYAVLDYATDAFNDGGFREPARWMVDGWAFRYHEEPADWALAPERDGATVTLACDLPHGGWVDFEHLEATGNAMRLVALPSGQVLWESSGTATDPYGQPGPHAAVAVPPGTTALRWEFTWGATSRTETVDYGPDAFNGGVFADPSRWALSGWGFQRQNDPDEYTDDIALAPQADGGTATLTADLPDGGRVEFEYGVAEGNLLRLVALPSGQVLWSSGGTGADPYGVPGPTAAVEVPAGTTAVRWEFSGTAVPPSGLRAYIDVVSLYRYSDEPAAPPSGLAGILDVVTLWRYEVRTVLARAWAETVCEPGRGNDAVRDAWECWLRKWEERHKGKALRRRWLVT